MTETLMITNDGDAIVTTTYWQTALARAGKFYLSTNAGVFRLLVPQQHVGVVREMRSAQQAVVSRGPYPGLGADMLEILCDDGTDTPFALHLSPGQVDRMPLDHDTAGTWLLTVWTHRVGQTGNCVLTLPAHYRRSRRLPDLRPWP